MSSLLNFLRILFVSVPLVVILALFRLIVIILLLPIIILLLIWRWIVSLCTRKPKDFPRNRKKKPCGRLPEAVIRRPDPCIYSQKLLQSQGLPVTWNNPDIWVARANNPANIEPDSYHLTEDTGYILSARVHNASADPAIGVRVRVNYRPWSFNSPDLTPIETDAGGNEVFKFVDVAPMSSAIAQFNWHTPVVGPDRDHKHFCLKAFLYHPMDLNISNNMGQENTNVYSTNPGHVDPGETINFEVPLFNLEREPQNFRFEAAIYEIDEKEKFELNLKTIRGRARRSPIQQVANFLPTLHAKDPYSKERGSRLGHLNFQAKTQTQLEKYKYTGYEKIKKAILSKDYSLPPSMDLKANGGALDKGVVLKSKESKKIKFTAKIPEDARHGSKLPLNVTALTENGVVVGGVTLLLNVK